MKPGIFAYILFLFAIAVSCRNESNDKIELSGTWQFAVDPNNEGLSEKWYIQPLEERISLPGSMASNGKGNDVNLNTKWTGQIVDSSFFVEEKYARFRKPENFKVPFWLQPVKHYVGAAWYQKEVDIPEKWDGQYIELVLERCHWESRLWVNGQEAGMRNSLGTPHIYPVSEYLREGKNIFTIRVDNQIREIDPGINSHSISDHTQTNWNGIIGEMYLESRPLVHIGNIKVYPDFQQKKATAKIQAVNLTGQSRNIRLSLVVKGPGSPGKVEKNFVLDGRNTFLDMDFSLSKQMKLWDEFDPNLYVLEAELKDEEDAAADRRKVTFGLREFKANERQFAINGRLVFLRGTLECAIFPKTGYPPTDVKSWSRIIRICKAHGLNHMRFHSWCPPKAAFEAADQEGFYFQVEVSSWANHSTTLGDGKPIDQYIYAETARMIDEYGNHPSFVMMAYGNEPGGPNQYEFLANYINHWKSADPRRLYVSAAGWPNIPENDYYNNPSARIQSWGAQLKSIINSQPPRSDYDWSQQALKFARPLVAHEIGQWCAYPDFKEISKYDGVLRARNFEIFQEFLIENGMGHLADSFLLASGKLQALCYKAEIEAALRTPGFGGFQLLDLHDFPGQGTALVGILNAFWEEKGYISPEEFRRFCNATVPLCRMHKHIYKTDEIFSAPVEAAHFGKEIIEDCMPEWRIIDEKSNIIRQGKLKTCDIPIGNAFELGNIAFDLNAMIAPAHYMLEISLGNYSNSWDFWVYPANNGEAAGLDDILQVHELDESAIKRLSEGGKVLLVLKKGTLAENMGGNVVVGFSSIFWNTAWTRGQAPHTLGILCDPNNPALAEFPTQYYSNWQWWDAMSHAQAIDLNSFSGINPIVRVIDDWFENRPLALIFEAKAGKGKLLVSGIDLVTEAHKRPEAQQLIYSLKKYMASDEFDPTQEIDIKKIKELVKQ